MVNLRWFLTCLLPIGLIAMAGCSPPKAAPVSQTSSNPPVPKIETESTPAATTTKSAAETPAASAPSGNMAAGGGMMAQQMPAYDPEAEAERIARYNAAQPGNRNNGNANDAGNNTASSPVMHDDGEEAGAGDESGADSEEGGVGLPPFPGPSGKKGTEVGDLIPEIKGKDFDKKSFKLSDYSGRVVMVDFWGDW